MILWTGIGLIFTGISMVLFLFPGFQDPKAFVFSLIGCLLSVVLIIVGGGLIKKQGWARIAVLILSVLLFLLGALLNVSMIPFTKTILSKPHSEVILIGLIMQIFALVILPGIIFFIFRQDFIKKQFQSI